MPQQPTAEQPDDLLASEPLRFRLWELLAAVTVASVLLALTH